MDNLVFGLASATEWLVGVVPFTKRGHRRGEASLGMRPMTGHGAYKTTTWTC